MDGASRRALRMGAQLLAGPPADGVLDAVERVVGVQAQSMSAARLAVRARTSGLTAGDVDRALAAGEVVRTWLMRGTLHLVAAADLGWLTGLFGPGNLAAGKRRREALGVDDATGARALAVIEGLLAGAGPMGRSELVARLAERGIRIDPDGQAPAHLVAYAAMSGLICRGPDLARGEPSVILAAALAGRGTPRRFSGDAALAELARRYLLGYGPAWSGLPAGTARRAFALLDAPVAAPAASDGALPVLVPRLLGQFDTVLLGHRDREFVLPAAHAKRVNAGGGMIAATVLVGGQVAGVWRRAGRKVTVEPFGKVAAKAHAAVEAEVADLGRFLGERLTAHWEE
jgi:hypothetical protein